MNRPTLTEDFLAAAATLERGSQSMRAVMAGEENRFTRALEALRELAEAEGMPIAIVGGLGAIRYGYPAATQDIDVAIGRSDLERLVKVAPRHGFRVAWQAETGWHILTFGDVEIKVVPEGANARNDAPTTIPGPLELGVASGLGYASLAGWFELKLTSARQKDLAHIVEVIKASSPQTIQEARQIIATVPEYANLFDRLYQQAHVEKEQEKKP